MTSPWFEPNFTDEREQELEVDVDAAVCSECKGTFLLPADTEVDECPLCGTKFDGEGD